MQFTFQLSSPKKRPLTTLITALSLSLLLLGCGQKGALIQEEKSSEKTEVTVSE
jgi:predicted small lipoprotein YifL